METGEILTAIERAGGKIWLAGERLGYRLPETMRPLMQELQVRKPEVLALFKGRTSEDNPLHDPAEWKPEFETWALAHCAFRDGCWGGIGCLHVAFCEWAEKESVPCSLQTFEWLLRDEGCELADGLVYGLVFKQDVHFWSVFTRNSDHSARARERAF